jgi:hypothetical protein
MPGRLSRIDVLVIDDWAMAPLSEPERRDFREICEDRYQVLRSFTTRIASKRFLMARIAGVLRVVCEIQLSF